MTRFKTPTCHSQDQQSSWIICVQDKSCRQRVEQSQSDKEVFVVFRRSSSGPALSV